MSKMSKFWKVMQGVGIATVGTVLAQPEIVTGYFTPATQLKVVGIITLVNAVLPSILPRKKSRSGESADSPAIKGQP